MPRRIAFLALGAISAIALYVSLSPGADLTILDDIEFDATYERGLATITYNDRSGLTDMVEMEILGMPETFHRTYGGPTFSEIVEFPGEPEYGWAIHPIVLDISRPEGDVRLKTEIRPMGEPPAPVIVSP